MNEGHLRQPPPEEERVTSNFCLLELLSPICNSLVLGGIVESDSIGDDELLFNTSQCSLDLCHGCEACR
jgi:hypothetical protein